MPRKEASAKAIGVERTPVNFIADVHLIRILGEQLISSEKVGVLELVKNAYDAGATKCEVWIEKVPGLPEAPLSDARIAELPGPVISIIDNGRGMSENTIKNGWLRPATRLKTSVKERLREERQAADKRGTRAEYERLVSTLKKQHGGRLPLGEKGVGRFATHRLGRYMALQTKQVGETHEWYLEIDWDKFDKPADDPEMKPLGLEDVTLTLLRRPSDRDYGVSESGTLLRIYGGREGFVWTEDTLRQIGFAIAQLRSPFPQSTEAQGFVPAFHCPQLSGETFDVLTNTVPAPFVCTAVVDEDGKADIEIRFIPPNTLAKPIAPETKEYTNRDLRRSPEDDPGYWEKPEQRSKLRRPECGPFTCELRVWLRVNEWIDAPDFKEFTDYLEEFGGIGIYRDGFSILPAQTAAKDDWLRLATRHIKKGSHISYYNLAGSIELLQEKNPHLVDRTSREGLLETRAYSDLGHLTRTIIFEVDAYVNATRERYSLLSQADRLSETSLTTQLQAAADVLKTLAEEYDLSKDPFGLRKSLGGRDNARNALDGFPTAFQQARRELSDVRDERNALLEAAGYGIAIAVAIHEIEKISSNLYFGLERLLNQAAIIKGKTYGQVQQLSDTSKSLLNELKRIAPLRVTRLEQPRQFSIRDSILAASSAFRLSWEELAITFIPPKKGADFEFQGSFGACTQVFANLFDNSTYWLRVSEGVRRIVVQALPDSRTVIVADTGSGIDERIRSHLFKPFFSLKVPPSGLGLYICKYYMVQMGGSIRESHDSERLPGLAGAHFTLRFPDKAAQR